MIKIIVFLFAFCITYLGYSQVGIGTDTPTPGYELDVEGSLLIQNYFKLENLESVNTESTNLNLLLRKSNSNPPGEVAKLDVKSISVAPVNIINYRFHNLRRDNVRNVDLQYDATKYIVGISNFKYDGEPIIKGQSNNSYTQLGYFVSRTFVQNGTWHLEIRNRIRNNSSNNSIEYNVSLIVFDRKYFKELPPKEVDLYGLSVGSAPAPIGL
ncbi:hypothetical protein [Aequorivita sp. KMM 9714]|uniref:hypothetical protein n=1 Tax=Aequorivita sp. KMM 9714 TaxID=2707173 RepID=UPI0013ED84C3|nr:hypothetical protein [Aequorivita sp. KMM 9714]NGX84157.1 hypothetical protein [Aequorivita sp. KMM 9714]